MYKNHMERLGAPIRKDLCYDASNEADAAKLTFDDSNIADYVAINNVKLTANEDTDPVFSTTGLGTNLEIDWSLLPAAESTAALAEDGDETEEPAVKDVKAEIIKAYNDAKTEGKDIYFNIQGSHLQERHSHRLCAQDQGLLHHRGRTAAHSQSDSRRQ